VVRRVQTYATASASTVTQLSRFSFGALSRYQSSRLLRAITSHSPIRGEVSLLHFLERDLDRLDFEPAEAELDVVACVIALHGELLEVVLKQVGQRDARDVRVRVPPEVQPRARVSAVRLEEAEHDARLCGRRREVVVLAALDRLQEDVRRAEEPVRRARKHGGLRIIGRGAARYDTDCIACQLKAEGETGRTNGAVAS
jgi:hypothetical protein